MLIVTDLDGTLLRTDRTISEYTKAILTRCREAGIKVAFATGRSSGDSDTMLSSVSFDARINMNGAIAKAGETLIYSRLISHETACNFLVSCDKAGIKVVSQTENMHYSNFAVSDLWHWIKNFEIVDFREHKIDAQKIYLSNLTSQELAYIKSILPDELYMVMANDNLLMIMHKEATKAKAVAALADFWGIERSEIITFGDDLNDIDMLSFAGTSVAMGNALGKVKSAASQICDTNDNDGVAKWIEQNSLGA